MEGSVRSCRLERSKADSCDLLFAVSPRDIVVSHTRRRARSTAKELLPPLFWTSSSTTRLSVSCRRNDARPQSTCMSILSCYFFKVLMASYQMQVTTSYLPGSQKSVKWAPEMLMLFWEALQCNKRFRSFIIDSNRSHDFVILCIFYATEYRSDPSKQGIVKMCIFILQTLSVEANFGKSLNKKFEAQDTLPQNIRIPGFRGSYADYLIIVRLPF